MSTDVICDNESCDAHISRDALVGSDWTTVTFHKIALLDLPAFDDYAFFCPRHSRALLTLGWQEALFADHRVNHWLPDDYPDYLDDDKLFGETD